MCWRVIDAAQFGPKREEGKRRGKPGTSNALADTLETFANARGRAAIMRTLHTFRANLGHLRTYLRHAHTVFSD